MALVRSANLQQASSLRHAWEKQGLTLSPGITPTHLVILANLLDNYLHSQLDSICFCHHITRSVTFAP